LEEKTGFGGGKRKCKERGLSQELKILAYKNIA
jgi:hypothetical protein